MIEKPPANESVAASAEMHANVRRSRVNGVQNILRAGILATAGLFVAGNAQARPPEKNVPAVVDPARLGDDALFKEVRKILGDKRMDDELSGIHRELEPRKLIPTAELRDDGLMADDFDDVSHVAKLAKLRREYAQQQTLIERLKPFLHEARRRRLPWSNQIFVFPPDEPRVRYTDGPLSNVSNKGLYDHVTRILGPAKMHALLSWSFQYQILEGRVGPVKLTLEESKKIAPYVAEADRRNLSWPNRIRRRMVQSAVVSAEPKEVPKAPEKKEKGSAEAQLKKMGVTVVYRSLPPDMGGDKASLPTVAQVQDALPRLVTLFKRYPPNMLARLSKVYLVANLRNSKGKSIGGTATSTTFWVNLDSGVYWTLDHEIFHNFDGRFNSPGEDDVWSRKNPGGIKDYTYRSGNEAINNGKGGDNEQYHGFANSYGKHGGPNEDQAVFGEQLMQTQSAKSLINRAKTDTVLVTKIEMITGCELDLGQGLFTRVIPEKEYKDHFGFGYQYYPKWSRDHDRVLMDADYWNMILQGNEPAFASN